MFFLTVVVEGAYDWRYRFKLFSAEVNCFVEMCRDILGLVQTEMRDA